MPRTHTHAVSWNSGVPTTFPGRSDGSVIRSRRTATCAWRKDRDGYTGIATSQGSSDTSDTT